MGAGRLQEHWERWSPSREHQRDWELLQSKISIALTTQPRLAGEELTALHTPGSNSSLEEEGTQKAPGIGDPRARLFFTSHLQDTNMNDSSERKQRFSLS